MADFNYEIKFEINKRIGVLNTNHITGWSRELNILRWNNNAPRLDIREWSADHERMTKGITLSWQEAKALRDLLNSIDEETINLIEQGIVAGKHPLHD